MTFVQALLHAKNQHRASAKGYATHTTGNAVNATQEEEVEEAAAIPHQIRGFLTSFMQVEPVVGCTTVCNATNIIAAIIIVHLLVFS